MLNTLTRTSPAFITRFLYGVWVLRLVFLISFVSFAVAFCTFFAPDIVLGQPMRPAGAVGLVCVLIIYVFIIYRFYYVLHTQRRILRFDDQLIYLRTAFCSGWQELPLRTFKGFSRSRYYTRFSDFDALIIYRADGGHWELPQFLYSNFRHIAPALECAGIAYLGIESSTWIWSLKRKYTFDDDDASQ